MPTSEEAKNRATFLFREIRKITSQARVRKYAAEGIDQMGFISLSAGYPAPIQNIVASQITGGSFHLQWDSVSNAVQYKVYLDGALNLATAGFEHDIFQLQPNKNYVVHVESVTAEGLGSYSVPKSIQTGNNTPPQWTAIGTQNLDVGVPYSVDFKLQLIDIDSHPVTISALDPLPSGLTLVNGVISGTPLAGGTSVVDLDAFDGYDHAQVAVTFAVQSPQDLQPPTQPVLGTPIVVGSRVEISLLTPSTDASGIASYSISRKAEGEAGFALLEPTLTSEGQFPFIDEPAPIGLNEYRCRSRDASANSNPSDFSPVVQATVVATDPGVPIQLAAVVLASGDDVEVTWDNNPDGATPDDYDLEHSIEANGGSSSGPWTSAGIIGTAEIFTHNNLPNGRVWYRVRANAGAQQSAFTAPISVFIGQPSVVDFRIPRLTGGNPTTTWDGSVSRVPLTGGPSRPVGPGDVIELEAGTWRNFTLLKVKGSATEPVHLKAPPTGRITFRRAAPGGTGFLVQVKDCKDFIWDGFTTDTNVPLSKDGKRHAFACREAEGSTPGNKDKLTAYVKFKGAKTSPVLGDPFTCTHHCLFRHWYFKGSWDENENVSLTSDAGQICFDSNDHNYTKALMPPGTWQESMTFEHFCVEDIGGEPTYFGPNPYTTYRGTNSEADGPFIPLRYVKCRHFYVNHTGGQAIQFKSIYGGTGGGDGPTENSIHDGVIIRCTSNVGPATNGTPAIAINSGKVDIYNNWIERCGGGGIALQVSDGTDIGFPDPSTLFKTRIYNNAIVDCGLLDSSGNGIRLSSYTGSTQPLDPAFKPLGFIFCNTILRYAGSSIKQESSVQAGGSIENNIVVSSGAISYGPITNSGSNLVSSNPAAIFVDPLGTYEGDGPDGTIDLRLLANQVAVGSIAPAGSLPGTWANSVDIPNFDINNNIRPGGTFADKGAYERV